MKKYTKDHEWIEIEGLQGVVGITDFAAKQLGDITYVELPKKGTDVIIGEAMGVVESVKAASDIFSPASGTIIESNSSLDDDPGLVNRSPEKEGWLCRIDNVDLIELEELMSKEQYDKFIKTSSK